MLDTNNNSYSEEINSLRAERNLHRQSMVSLTTSIEAMLKIFDSDKGNTMITFDTLYLLSVGETHIVNPLVRFRLIEKHENRLVFKTFVEPNGEFGYQKHNTPETIKIIKGHLIEQTRDDTVYVKGDTVTYATNEIHKPKAIIGSEYLVTFNRPQIK